MILEARKSSEYKKKRKTKKEEEKEIKCDPRQKECA